MELDFEVDKITESIELAATGERFETDVVRIFKASELSEVTEENGWYFDWRYELRQPNRQVCKLITEKEPEIIQGLISFEMEKRYIFMPLIETAPLNFGSGKKYVGVPGNLIAYVCKLSEKYGFGGVVSFVAKTKIISHYEETLGAEHIGGGRMIIWEEDAKKLLDKYFPDERSVTYE